MSNFKEKVLLSYNQQASHYIKHKTLQTNNLRQLLNYLATNLKTAPQGKLLDVGCGDGTLLGVLREQFQKIECTYTGIDLSRGLLDLAKKQYGEAYEFRIGDAEKLEFHDNSFDIFFSNSVFHWLNVPECNQTPLSAIQESLRVLKPGGKLALSISGEGTGRRFQQAYLEVMEKLRIEKKLLSDTFQKDPIGSMKLFEVVDILLNTGYTIELAVMDYEPVAYKFSSAYVEDVKAYGYNIFMAQVPDKLKEYTWEQVRDSFMNIVGETNYFHDQYMNYVIATKPHDVNSFGNNKDRSSSHL